MEEDVRQSASSLVIQAAVLLLFTALGACYVASLCRRDRPISAVVVTVAACPFLVYALVSWLRGIRSEPSFIRLDADSLLWGDRGDPPTENRIPLEDIRKIEFSTAPNACLLVETRDGSILYAVSPRRKRRLFIEALLSQERPIEVYLDGVRLPDERGIGGRY